MSEFHFLRPLWLLALPPLLLLAWWCLRAATRQAGAWASLIDPALLPGLLRPAPAGGRRLPFALLLAGWTLALLALAGPSWERLPEPVHRGSDALVIALDLSQSMQSTDVAPSRIERARFKLRDLLATRRDGFTALVAWAGDAHIVTPLSDDTGTVTALLDALEPSIMPEPGSDPVAAVRLAGELLRGSGMDRGRVLLVADALSAEQAAAIAPLLDRHGLELSVLAVGTAAGAPVPLPGGGFARERDGSIAVPALDGAGMRAASAAAGGRFAELSLDDSDLRALLPQSVRRARPEAAFANRRFDQWLDRAPWIACLLLPLAAAAFRRGWLLVLPLALLLAPPRALAMDWESLWLTRDQRGARALAEGDAARAAQTFRSPGWRGTAAYEAGDYPGAAEAFAALEGADADYNRGNALARAGRLEEALAAYDAALAAQPGMPDAVQNRALVEDLLKQQQAANPPAGAQDGQEQSPPRPGSGGAPPSQPDGEGQDAARQGRPGAGQDADGRRGGEQTDGQPGESGPRAQDDEPGGAATATPDAPESGTERAQALEQWLRQVPDDPGALLRRKFEYESRARRATGGR